MVKQLKNFGSEIMLAGAILLLGVAVNILIDIKVNLATLSQQVIEMDRRLSQLEQKELERVN